MIKPSSALEPYDKDDSPYGPVGEHSYPDSYGTESHDSYEEYA